METKKIIFIVMGLFLVSLVCAVPLVPNHFMGNVTLYGEKAPIGTEISVFVDGDLESVYNVTEEGKYNLYVKTGESGGETITFTINDKLAGNSKRTNGETISLNLTISDSPIPVIPPVSPPASSSGGGGGGGGGGTPSTVKDLSSDLIASNNSDLNLEVQDSESEVKLTEDKVHSAGFLTGAAIGTVDFMQSKTGVFVFIVFVGLGIILIKFKPLKKWIKKIQY